MLKFLLLALIFLLASCGSTVQEAEDTTMDKSQHEYIVYPTVHPSVPAPPPQRYSDYIPVIPDIPTPIHSDLPLWEEVASFVCHYGTFTDMLGLFDVAIIEPQQVTRAQLAWLRDHGTFTIGYISVGEDTQLRTMDGQGPGGYASFYIDDGHGNPSRNNNWDSYFVDAGNSLWQQHVINRTRELIGMGFDGIFLDTIDTAEIFPDTQAGMANLIRRLRDTFPDIKIVANRGFFLLEEIAPYISGLMFEAFTGGYNFTTQDYTVHAGGDLAWTTARADEINRIRETHYFPVFALDYASPYETTTIQKLYNRAWEYDFLPSVSTIRLNRVFWREIEPQTQRGVRSGLTRWNE